MYAWKENGSCLFTLLTPCIKSSAVFLGDEARNIILCCCRFESFFSRIWVPLNTRHWKCTVQIPCSIRQAQLPSDFSGMLPGSTCSSDFGPETFFLQTVLPVTVLHFRVNFLGSVAGINELCVAPWACNTGSDLHLPFAVSQNSLILHASYVNHKFIVWHEDVFLGFWCPLAGWRDVVVFQHCFPRQWVLGWGSLLTWYSWSKLGTWT